MKFFLFFSSFCLTCSLTANLSMPLSIRMLVKHQTDSVRKIQKRNNSFKNCLSLPSISLPSATSIDAYSFFNCDSLTSINLPACTNLGGTTGDDNVFTLISGNTITATFNVAVSINNSGNPDGDIQYLQSFNTTSITYI